MPLSNQTQSEHYISALLRGICAVEQDIPISGVVADSRVLKPGDLFLATTGETVDARDYISEALARGAAAVVYEEAGYSRNLLPPSSAPLFPISDLKQWQGVIAARFYGEPAASMHCIGVTGTNGKTTSTQWMAQALSECGYSCGVVGTLGAGLPGQLSETTHTTPDAIAMQALLAQLRQQGAQAAALEVSSHALQQQRLSGVPFEVAVFTQLSRDHLDYHGDMASYAAAKARLFAWPGLKAAVINIDDPIGRQWQRDFSEQYPILSYSLRKESDACIRVLGQQAHSQGFAVTLQTPWGRGRFSFPFLGLFNVSNLLAVLGVLGYFEIPLERALACCECLPAIPGRMERLGGGRPRHPTVIVDYAHTPDALQQVLQALRQHTRGHLYCVFGCGGERDRGKRAPMAQIAEQYSDHIVVTQDNPRGEPPQQIIDDMMLGFSAQGVRRVTLRPDRAEAIDYAIRSARPGDVVLLAGKGHEADQLWDGQKRALSDRECARQVLSALGE